MNKVNLLLKTSILVLGLSLCTLPFVNAAAETDTAAETTVENTADNVQDAAQGFDDWGLLGLLGLRGNRNVVVDGTRR